MGCGSARRSICAGRTSISMPRAIARFGFGGGRAARSRTPCACCSARRSAPTAFTCSVRSAAASCRPTVSALLATLPNIARGGTFIAPMSQPPLPKVSGRGGAGLADGARGRSAAGRLFPVVFTLPAAISPIAYQNEAVVYNLLFRTAAETLLTIAADPKHLGARIGATAVLHSWGSTMTHHPHIHMIVPGGGISLDGTRWVRCKP